MCASKNDKKIRERERGRERDGENGKNEPFWILCDRALTRTEWIAFSVKRDFWVFSSTNDTISRKIVASLINDEIKKCVNYAGLLLADNRDIHKEKINKVFKINSNFISQNYKLYIRTSGE